MWGLTLQRRSDVHSAFRAKDRLDRSGAHAKSLASPKLSVRNGVECFRVGDHGSHTSAVMTALAMSPGSCHSASWRIRIAFQMMRCWRPETGNWRPAFVSTTAGKPATSYTFFDNRMPESEGVITLGLTPAYVETTPKGRCRTGS